MPPRLLPHFPLSQVVFIHDYVQLVFQDARLSVYNSMAVKPVGSATCEQGKVGFADLLVSLIGKTVVEIPTSCKSALVLRFECGTEVHVLSAEGNNGREAFQFTGPNGLVVVEQNE